MRNRRCALALGLLALAGAHAGVAAQEATPGVSVVRFFECPLGNLSEAVEILNGDWRGHAQDLVEEGMLIDYGILTHSWGDEWNLVDYFVVTDQAAFQQAWRELLLRWQADDSDGEQFQRFGELCPRHKDNIYSVVPPS